MLDLSLKLVARPREFSSSTARLHTLLALALDIETVSSANHACLAYRYAFDFLCKAPQ